MNFLKKSLVTIIFGVLFLATVPQFLPVYAQEDVLKSSCSTAEARATEFCKNVQQDKSNPFNITDSDSPLLVVAQVVVFITAAASVIMVVIGGFKYVVSGGDANGIKSAKDTILYALIGLVVAVFAQIIVSFVLNRFL